MMIVIFDVGNVIVKSNTAITYRVLEEYGVSKDRVKTFFKNEEYREFSRGNIDARSFYRALINNHLKFQLTYKQIVQAHDAHMHKTDRGVLKVLNKLSRRKLAFLTDTNKWQTQREHELIDLNRYSDRIFRSHEIRMLKIDDGLIPYLINQLKIKPNRALFVDDSPEKIQKAKEHGLNTLKFINSKQLDSHLRKFKLY